VCPKIVLKLSPLIDGELRRGERIEVESHLASCQECAARAADLRAESALIRVGMELLADDADLRDFSKKVMSRISPAPAPLFERWRVSLSELLTHRRGMMISVGAAAAAVLAIAPLWLIRSAPDGYASAKMAVKAVSTVPEAHVAPVVMAGAENGDAIIWLVSHKHVLEEQAAAEAQQAPELSPQQKGQELKPIKQERPHGGEL
jgi:anti-sigma factor RsiW